jgi:hypothetical protein
MSEAAIASALSQQLSNLDYPVAWENDNFNPPAGEIYVAESMITIQQASVGLSGKSSDEHLGIYQVTVVAPMGETKGPMLKAADDVLKLFKKAAKIKHCDQTVTILRVQKEQAIYAGDRVQLPISIYYRAFTK